MSPFCVSAILAPRRSGEIPKSRILGICVVAALVVAGCANPLSSDDPGPVVGQGRLQRPEDGFGVAFPNDWTVFDVTESGSARAWQWPVDAGSVHRLVLRTESCYVQVDDRHARLSLDAYVARLMRKVWTEPVTEPSHSSEVLLPAGRAWRIDAVHESGWHYTEYVLGKDGDFYVIGCGANAWEQPEDRWLAIAETFEFLPAEE